MARAQLDALRGNCAEFGVELHATGSGSEGIVHVIGPELGLTQPGQTIVCGDSHTSTHGAFGALAFGIGTSEVEHVLATQTLPQRRPRTMLVEFIGLAPAGLTPKDVILGAIGRLGVSGGVGHVVEYAGEVIRGFSMEGRMTVCNMSIEWGARAGLDRTRRHDVRVPRGQAARTAGRRVGAGGRSLARAADGRRRRVRRARPDRGRRAGAAGDLGNQSRAWSSPSRGSFPTRPTSTTPTIAPPPSGRSPTWVSGPAPRSRTSASTVSSSARARTRGSRICARPPPIVAGKHVADGVVALAVPGSAKIRAQAEAEGLDRIFIDAGFEWRRAGCSMCLGMNPDILAPGERCASTSNRNFEGRQGRAGRTHLVSPAMAAAAAIHGHFVDVRALDAATA